MAKQARRAQGAGFKATMALAAIRNEQILAELAELVDMNPVQIVAWKAQVQEGAAATGTVSMADGKLLHAKIGELTPEKVFSFSALNKRRGLSANRSSAVAMSCPDAAGWAAEVEPWQRPLSASSGASGAAARHAPG